MVTVPLGELSGEPEVSQPQSSIIDIGRSRAVKLHTTGANRTLREPKIATSNKVNDE